MFERMETTAKLMTAKQNKTNILDGERYTKRKTDTVSERTFLSQNSFEHMLLLLLLLLLLSLSLFLPPKII